MHRMRIKSRYGFIPLLRLFAGFREGRTIKGLSVSVSAEAMTIIRRLSFFKLTLSSPLLVSRTQTLLSKSLCQERV